METEYIDISTGSRKRKGSNTGSVIFTVAVTAFISIIATLMIVYYINGGVIFTKSTKYGDLTKVYGVSEVIDNVDKNFYPYNDKQPTDEEMSVTAMKAIVDSLDDRYAGYYTAEEYEKYSRDLHSSFKGVGITVQKPNATGSLISSVIKDSPAERAGLLPNDIITAVNGVSVAGTELSYVTSLIGGEEGEAVVFSIKRGDTTLEITAYYGDVILPTVSCKVIDNHIGYIYISQFADNTADEFQEKLDELSESETEAVIIDVRGNPGGYLNSVVSIADKILDKGIIVNIGNTMNDPALEVFEAKKGGISMPIVLLIDENSASASEILASAVKENGAGILIGNTTYGKGIVQTTGQLYSTDGYLKLTTSGYFTPNGNNIHGRGVSPDINVYMSEDLQKTIGTDIHNDATDPQLQRAISWIKGDRQ